MDDHDDIEFDIEGMTFEPSQGIASSSASQIQDGGAVISAAEEVMLQKKKSDPRFRTQVCSFWIEGRCMKGETCEFLHRYDTDKMPACRFGENCHIKDCPFRHVKEEDKPECILYKQGFCPHGPYCKYRHAKHGPAELPEEAPFLLRGYHGNNQDGGQPGGGGRGGYHHDPARQARRHEFFKVSLCKNWEKTATCPFGDRCHFAHGAAELRRPPAAGEGGGGGGGQGGQGGGGGGQGGADSDEELEALPARAVDVDYARLPVSPHETCRFFVVHSVGYKNLAVSVKQGRWAVARRRAPALNTAFNSVDRVIFLFSVRDSKHFQGCAQMMAPVPPSDPADASLWSPLFHVRWLRICELPFRGCAFLKNPYDAGRSVIRSRDCQELHPTEGPKVLALLWEQPEVELHEDAMQGELELYEFTLPDAYDEPYRHAANGAAAGGGPGAAAAAAAAPGGGATEFPVQPGGGFVFGCNARTMDECMAKMLFGLPANMEALLAQHVRPGAPLFLHNLTSKQMFGVFAAASAPALNLDPAAWARPAVARLGAAVASSSPFPCQVRVVLQLTCPPVPEYDPGLQAILRQRPKMIGPVTEEQAQQLANLFALYGGHIQKNPINIKGGPKQGGWYEPRNPYFQKIFVRMQSHPGFNVSAKLVGKNGDQVKTIMNECQGNTRLRLRGRGSTYREGPAQVEAPEELHFLVSAAEVGAMAEAVRRTEELVEKIREEYLEFLESPAAQAAGPIPLPPVPFPPMGLPPGAGGFPPRGMGLPPPGMLPPGFLPPGGPMGGFLPPRGPRGLPPF